MGGTQFSPEQKGTSSRQPQEGGPATATACPEGRERGARSPLGSLFCPPASCGCPHGPGFAGSWGALVPGVRVAGALCSYAVCPTAKLRALEAWCPAWQWEKEEPKEVVVARAPWALESAALGTKGREYWAPGASSWRARYYSLKMTPGSPHLPPAFPV